MTVEEIVAAWKDPALRTDATPEHPAGAMARELAPDELAAVVGADCGCGWVCTYTGECTCTNGVTVCDWSGC